MDIDNDLDITGDIKTVVFTSKIPDHCGLALTSGMTVDLNNESLVLKRTGPGLTMKIQAKDCAQGGVFQMEMERADGTATGCPNNILNPLHPGSVNHCGGVSQWSVESGGRMGQVMGEDATEIPPAATLCTENCTAQNQVNGRAVVVGFPFPVPDEVRLKSRFYSGFVLP